MKSLPIPFEPTASFCYRLARYHLLNEIASEPEAMTGEPFKLSPVATRVIGRYLTDDQQAMTYPARDTDGKLQQVGSALKFLSRFELSAVLNHHSFGLAVQACTA